MSSDVEICNSALIKIGASTIMSIDPSDGSRNANACASQYPIKRDELLRAHPWNFAITRVKLARSAVTPPFGWTYAYALPSDWMRTLNVYDNPDESGLLVYRIESVVGAGNCIVTEATDVYLRYVRQIVDTNAMDPQFREVLAWSLAVDLSVQIAGSDSSYERAVRGLSRAISSARSTDAIEDYPEDEPEGDWNAVRHSASWERQW